MQESKLLGTLLPSSPDFLPIVQAMREKYELPEISPDDDPIMGVFLNGELVALEDFRQEIKALVEKITDRLLPELSKALKQPREAASIMDEIVTPTPVSITRAEKVLAR